MRDLHAALIEITATMNRPQQDEALLETAGVTLDRALFRLLVGVARRGPVPVVELSALLGLDHSTVSRQISRLEELGLLCRQVGQGDRRVREVAVTEAGLAMTARIDQAREQASLGIFADWEAAEIEEFVRLLSRFARSFREARVSEDEGKER